MTEAPPDTAFVCTDMVVRFGAVPALDGCSMTLPSRGAISVIGENGSGKSTLLDVLSGFVPLTAGSVTDAAGTDCSRSVLRGTVSRLHQRVVLPPQLGVHEYLSICARASTAARVSTPQSFFAREEPQDQALDELLSATGIVDRTRNIDQLSWGQQRIVAVCGILATSKIVVLLDEPFAGIAGPVRKILMDVLVHAAQTRLVVFSEHDLRYAARAERVIVLKAGRVARDVPATELPESSSLMPYFGE